MRLALSFLCWRIGRPRWRLPNDALHLQSNHHERASPALLFFSTVFAYLIFALPASAVPSTTPSPPRAALVIGNAEYDSVGALMNPVNDAHDICRELNDLGFKASCYFNVSTRVQMRALIQDYVESLPTNAVSFVYYAGHAVQVNGENYLIPTRAQLRSESALASESVSLAYVMRELRRNQAFLNVVILDACRNNPLAMTNGGAARGLAQVTDVPDGTMVLYATAADELALDGAGHNGIMTKNILANIREPGTVDDLFKQVSLGVQKDTQALGRPQEPALYTNFAGLYCLVRCTDLEILQEQRRRAEAKIFELQVRVAAGDQSALAKLADVRASNEKLQEQIRKKDEEARKAENNEREKQKKSFVPPAF
jgi:uncharacterized caspase-like protein